MSSTSPLKPSDIRDARLSPEVERWGRPLIQALQRYHQHQMEGLEHIPAVGGAIVAASHSLATYDGFMMGLEVYDRTGRLMTGLGDDLIFKIPGLKSIALGTNIYPASPENGRILLEAGHLLGLAPGGMRESLRPSTERYQIRWDKRKGFVRLAIRAQVPVILAATPGADDIYRVYESRLTKVAYKALKVPVPVARGIGLSPLPRPVQLTTWLSEPIHPPEHDPENEAEQVDTMHEIVCQKMDELMARGPQG